MPFTPVHSLLGGSLLFLASQQYMLLFDKTFGCSSIMAQTMLHPAAAIEGLQAPAFAGMLLASYVYTKHGRSLLPPTGATAFPVFTEVTGDIPKQALAGLLVGLGTRLANGCTSGHMLNGLAKLSLRSLVATCCFFGSALVTVALAGTAPTTASLEGFFEHTALPSQTLAQLFAVVGAFYALTAVLVRLTKAQRDAKKPVTKRARILGALFAGVTFATGLLMSGMYLPAKTLGFLNMWRAIKGYPDADFDPSLLMIVLGGLLPNLIMTQLYTKHQKPLLADPAKASATTGKGPGITQRLVIGSLMFGVGWGLSGVCPGPAAVNIVSRWPLPSTYVAFVASVIGGSAVAEYL